MKCIVFIAENTNNILHFPVVFVKVKSTRVSFPFNCHDIKFYLWLNIRNLMKYLNKIC